MYLTVTLLDITNTMGLFSQFVHTPQEIYWPASLRVLTYLKHALRHGLLYIRHDHLCMEAYYDSSYASNRGDHKSIFEYCTLAGGGGGEPCHLAELKAIHCLSLQH